MPVQTRRQKKDAALSLKDLPVELLDRIFELAYEDNPAPPSGPICRALLPFQRRRILRLSIVKGKKATTYTSLLSSVPSLQRLTLKHCKDLVALLSALPQPSSLFHLSIDGGSIPADTARSSFPDILATFSSLKTLELDCPCEPTKSDVPEYPDSSSYPSILSDLADLPHLEHLTLGEAFKLNAEDLDFEALPDSLEKLTLNLFDGEHGEPGEECGRWQYFLASWTLPKWRDGFNYEDAEELVQQAEEKWRLEVDGTILQALSVEASFKSEKEEFWRIKEEEREERDFWKGGGGWGRRW
ncbi:hypothetical protein JCM10207_004331 [Rhodosporidiobolus poonsookiae]